MDRPMRRSRQAIQNFARSIKQNAALTGSRAALRGFCILLVHPFFRASFGCFRTT
jgi:hypothetical protein